MKDLKVRYWDARKHWVIDARLVGLNNRYGNYPSQKAAIKEAELLKAKFITGAIAEKVDVVKVSQAVEKFYHHQTTRQENKEVSISFFKEIKTSLDYCLAIKIDGKKFLDQSFDIIKRENKSELVTAFVKGITDEGKSKATAEKRIKVLKMFLNYCDLKGWITMNPLDKVSLGMSAEIGDRAPRIQPETIQKIVSDGLPAETLYDQCMVLTALASGMRQGELRALKWGNIDFDDLIVNVEGAVKHGTMVIGDTKTKRGRRQIPIDAQTMKKLKELKVASKFSAPGDIVFASSNGTPKVQKILIKLIKRVCNTAGVKPILWGDMRHFYASDKLSTLGEDWTEVAALMGHSNPNFTYKQYGHFIKNKSKQDKVRQSSASAIYGRN